MKIDRYVIILYLVTTSDLLRVGLPYKSKYHRLLVKLA